MRDLERRLSLAESELRDLRQEVKALRESRASAMTAPVKNVTVAAAKPEPIPVKVEAAKPPPPVSAAPPAAASPRPTPPSGSPPPGPVDGIAERMRGWAGQVPMEEFIGLNLLNKLGITILTIGLVFFLRIAWSWVGPAVKLAGLCAVALGSMAAAEFLMRRNRSYRIFGLGVLAGAWVLLYFCAYASYNIDATRVLPAEWEWIGYVLMLAVSAGMVLRSLRFDSEAYTASAYALAFLCISINDDGSFNHFSLIALAILGCSLIVIMTLRRWKFLAVLGLIGVYANFFWYSLSLPRDTDGLILLEPHNYFLFSLAYLSIYWLIFIVSTFTIRTGGRIAASVNIANALAFFALSMHLGAAGPVRYAFGVAAILGLVYTATALLGRLAERTDLWRSSVILAAGFLAVAVPLHFSEHELAVAWLALSVLLMALGLFFDDRYLRYPGYIVGLLHIGVFFGLAADDAPDRVYLFGSVMLSFWALQAFTRFCRFQSDPADRFVFQALGALATLAALLFAFALSPEFDRPVILAALSLFLIFVHRMFAIGPFLLYAVVLQVAGLFVWFAAGGHPFAGSDAAETSEFGLIACACAAVLTFFYGHHLAPERQRIYADLPFAGPERLSGTALWTAAAAGFVYILRTVPDSGVTLATLVLIGSFVALHFFYRKGLAIVAALMFAALVYNLVRADGSTGVVLANLIPLWILGASAYAYCAYLLESGGTSDISFRYPRIALREGGAVVAGLSVVLGLMAQLEPVHPELVTAAFLAYALLLAMITGLLSRAALAPHALFFQILGTLLGPFVWLFDSPNVTHLEWTLLYIGVLVLGTACTILLLGMLRRKDVNSGLSACMEFSYAVSLVAMICFCISIPAKEFIAGALALLAVANYEVLRRTGRPHLYPLAYVALFAAAADFLFLLGTFALNESDFPWFANILLGLVPLALTALCLGLHRALFEVEAGSTFERGVIIALLCGFILLTMSTLDATWWSLVWALQAAGLVTAGLLRRAPVLRYGGFVLIGLALVKLAAYDLRNLDSTLRVLVLVGIGLLLVAASFLYARFKDRIVSKDE